MIHRNRRRRMRCLVQKLQKKLLRLHMNTNEYTSIQKLPTEKETVTVKVNVNVTVTVKGRVTVTKKESASCALFAAPAASSENGSIQAFSIHREKVLHTPDTLPSQDDGYSHSRNAVQTAREAHPHRSRKCNPRRWDSQGPPYAPESGGYARFPDTVPPPTAHSPP